MNSSHAEAGDALSPKRVHEYLCSNLVDKLVAWGMVLIGARFLWASVSERQGLPLLLLLAQGVIHNFLLLIRYSPRRITLNPLYWIVPVAGTRNRQLKA